MALSRTPRSPRPAGLSARFGAPRRWAALLVGGVALGSVACGVARPAWEARTLLPAYAHAAQLVEPAESFEAALLARVNADRAAHGLRALAFDPELQAPARARAAAQEPGQPLTHAAP